MKLRHLCATAGSLAVLTAGLAVSAPADARPGASTNQEISATKVHHGAQPHGHITLTHTAPQLVPYETTLLAEGTVSRNLRRDQSLRAQYLDPVRSRWRGIPGAKTTWVTARSFQVLLSGPSGGFAGLTSKQGLRLRMVTDRTHRLARTVERWTADSYAVRPLADLPVAAGSRLTGSIAYYVFAAVPQMSEAVSPTDSVTLVVPPGCGRFQGAIAQDESKNPPSAYRASIAVNGQTAWARDNTQGGVSIIFSIDIHGGDTLTLSVDFPQATPDARPWFVTPWYPTDARPDRLPFVLCAAP